MCGLISHTLAKIVIGVPSRGIIIAPLSISPGASYTIIARVRSSGPNITKCKVITSPLRLWTYHYRAQQDAYISYEIHGLTFSADHKRVITAYTRCVVLSTDEGLSQVAPTRWAATPQIFSFDSPRSRGTRGDGPRQTATMSPKIAGDRG